MNSYENERQLNSSVFGMQKTSMVIGTSVSW